MSDLKIQIGKSYHATSGKIVTIVQSLNLKSGRGKGSHVAFLGNDDNLYTKNGGVLDRTDEEGHLVPQDDLKMLYCEYVAEESLDSLTVIDHIAAIKRLFALEGLNVEVVIS